MHVILQRYGTRLAPRVLLTSWISTPTPLHSTPLQEFNLTLGQSSGASVQPWVVGAIVGNMAGQSADFLVNKVRKERSCCA